MARPTVASDASPLIGLAAAGAFDLLRKLFGRIAATPAVRDEVLAGGGLPGAAELAAAIREGWVEVLPPGRSAPRFPELGAGEESTLGLALEREGCLVLMDDPVGRARARSLGLPVTGLAGVLLAARRAGAVRRLRPLFDRLAEHGFRLSADLVRAVLAEADESAEG
jgi:predicted nucleic acid-binding protein